MNKNFLNVNNIRDYSTLSHKQIRNNINGLKKLRQTGMIDKKKVKFYESKSNIENSNVNGKDWWPEEATIL